MNPSRKTDGSIFHDPVVRVLLLTILVLVGAILVLLLRHTEKPAILDRTQATWSPLQGWRWVSYGDSITDGGYWQPAVAEAFAFEHIEQGISGTCVAGRSPRPFWQAERMADILAQTPDLLTIMGGTNDFYSDIPLGSPAECDRPPAEKDVDSFYGAYSYLIESLLTRNPQLHIILMTTPLNDTWFAGQQTNGAGYTIMDYADATAQLAAHYQLPLVDLRELYASAELFQADYWDGIHPNLDGCAKISQILIHTLIQLSPESHLHTTDMESSPQP